MLRYVHRCLKFTLLALVLGVITLSPAEAQPNGESLFKANCTSCHVVGDKKVVGPGLKNVHQRRSEAWLLSWIKNSSALIKSGDADAIKVFEDNNKIAMPAFSLKEDEIKAVIAYIKTESEKAPAAPVASADGTSAGAPADKADNFPIILLSVVILLIGIYYILNKVKQGLEKVVRQREGLPEPVVLKGKANTKHWIREHKKLIAFLLILGTVIGSVKGWNALSGIGVSTGYQPDQPIKFSHALHAGTNKIDCRYCHTGAEKAKNANIPSANVCMNCHKYVSQGPKYGTVEIAKIYKAIDWDPATSTYGPNQKPIEWVRIHNLPDLAYFNHSQHVTVGGLACQTCHGPVQEMEVVSQFSPLTMGWCINCHRTTEVKMAGNGYYTKLHGDLMKKYGPEAKLTVDKIGGLECARCHY
jgi:mono/diheme cytochrome c family protein